MVKKQNIYVLDKKIGDVNGDKIPDIVLLIGDKDEHSFYEKIRVMVQDGKTNQQYIIPLYPNYSMAYTPWLFLGSFAGSNADEIMISLPVGGSGALTYYYLISFVNNKADVLLGPEQFIVLSENMGYEVIYKDHYKVLVNSNKLNQSYTIDVNDRKDYYEGIVYDKEGRLIKPLDGFVIYQPHLYPIKFDGDMPYKLEARQDIAGTSHADKLGSIVTYWQYNGLERSWRLDPEMFFIMLG